MPDFLPCAMLTALCGRLCCSSPEPAGDGVLSARAAGAALQRGRQTLAPGPLAHPAAARWENTPHTQRSLHIFSSGCTTTRSNFTLFRRREGSRREGRCQSWRERKAPGSAARRGLHNRARLPGLHVEVGGVSLSFPPSSALSLANCLFVLFRPVCLFFVSKDLKT